MANQGVLGPLQKSQALMEACAFGAPLRAWDPWGGVPGAPDQDRQKWGMSEIVEALGVSYTHMYIYIHIVYCISI